MLVSGRQPRLQLWTLRGISDAKAVATESFSRMGRFKPLQRWRAQPDRPGHQDRPGHLCIRVLCAPNLRRDHLGVLTLRLRVLRRLALLPLTLGAAVPFPLGLPEEEDVPYAIRIKI